MPFDLSNLVSDRVPIWLIVAFFVTASLTTYDKRINQAIMRGNLDRQMVLPKWYALFIYLEYGALIWVAFLDWRTAIVLYVAGFVLAVLPVLEFVGWALSLILAPRRRA